MRNKSTELEMAKKYQVALKGHIKLIKNTCDEEGNRNKKTRNPKCNFKSSPNAKVGGGEQKAGAIVGVKFTILNFKSNHRFE